jgi:hypothetical protein
MPKSVNLLPNLRIDIEDYRAQTSGFVRDALDSYFERYIIDNAPGIAEGFRVEIADQGTSPRLLNIVSGNAIARDGRQIRNEEDSFASRSVTLPGNGTYYVEIEFVESASDVDARAFWDPSYDNGTDPSGDPIPSGREFAQNVSTRLTPDWKIVSPVSTTGFEMTSNPDSIKLPVAVITVAAGVITGGTTSPISSTLREAVIATATTLKLLNTRAMPDAFTLNLDPGGPDDENVTVTANDRENATLTLAGPGTASGHALKTRVVVAGATPEEYLVERAVAALPTSGTEDARPHLFRGDEELGDVLAVDPAGTGDARADTSIESLKRYVDFMASQIRELKFGSGLAADVGNIAPPSTFPVAPRYYEIAGSVAGGRTCTVSVGDGVTTWGDFNVVQSGSAQAAIQAAHDALPAAGGTIYIKTGTYVLTNTTITLSNPCLVVGDGAGTVLQSNGTAALFTITGADIVVRDLVLDYDSGGSTATELISISAAATRLQFLGLRFTEDAEVAPAVAAAAGATKILFDRCQFECDQGMGTFAQAVDFTVTNCTITFEQNLAGLTLSGNALRVNISNTKFDQLTTAIATTGYGIIATGSLNEGSITDCVFISCDYGISLSTVDNAIIKGCTFTIDTILRSRAGITANGSAESIDNLTIDSCRFDGFAEVNATRNAAVDFSSTVLDTLQHVKFVGCTIVSVTGAGDAYGLYLGAASAVEDITITGCTIQSLISTGIAIGIEFHGAAPSRTTISGSTFRQIGTSSTPTAAGGIRSVATGNDWNISGNTFREIGGGAGGAGGSALDAVIRLGATGQSTQYGRILINGNNISDVDSSTTMYGVSLVGSGQGAVISNNHFEAELADFVGIYVASVDVDSTSVRELSITGNVIRRTTTNFSVGIDLAFNETTSPLEGRVTLSGNTVVGFTARGIGIIGGAQANGLISVSGNVVETNQSTGQAILLQDCIRFAVTGNSVHMSNTTGGGETGIMISGCDFGTVSSNFVCVRGAASGDRGINAAASSSQRIMIAGNCVELGDSGAGAIAGTGIEVGVDSFCAANYIQKVVASGAGTAITVTGAGSKTEAMGDADSSTQPEPSAVTDIGLNWRET